MYGHILYALSDPVDCKTQLPNQISGTNIQKPACL